MPAARISLFSALVAALCLMLAACAGTIAPNRWLEIPSVTQHEAYGAWARLETGIADMTHTEGELIAVTTDSIFILDTLGFLSGFSDQDLRRVHLQSFDSRHGLVAFWTVLGTLSTISHGVVLIISAPVWIISGSIASGAQSQTAHEYAVPSEWLALANYARFPQGLPPESTVRASKSSRTTSPVNRPNSPVTNLAYLLPPSVRPPGAQPPAQRPEERGIAVGLRIIFNPLLTAAFANSVPPWQSGLGGCISHFRPSHHRQPQLVEQ